MEKKIKVAEKLMNIICTIADSEEGLTAREVAEILDLKVTTVHTIISTLLSLGYLEKDETTKKYRISDKLLEVFLPLISKNALLKAAEPIMRSLAEGIRESVVLGVFYKGERYTIAACEYEGHLLNVNVNMLKLAPCYLTATGRVLLAHLPEEDVKGFVEKHGYPHQAWNNIRSYQELKKELERIRRDKIEIIEHESAVAVGAPIYNSSGKVIASLGVYLPIVRFKGEHKERVIKEVKRAAEEISLRLGFYGS